MKILNFGSLNIDYVYQVAHMVLAGETQKSFEMNTFVGGKGLNQSIALKRAGLAVFHAGMIGEDGQILLDTCKENEIDTTYIKTMPGKSGHTIIQVDENGQNCILLHGGSNDLITEDFIEQVLTGFSEGDYIILQNEIEGLNLIIEKAYMKKMKIILNPSPYNEKLKSCDLNKVSIFILNEIEGKMICDGNDKPKEIMESMLRKYPKAKIVLTLGSDGSYYYDQDKCYYQKIFPAKAVDTTAAGDTFTGYFIAGLVNQMEIEDCMELAAAASSLAVTQKGAVSSIPLIEKVEEYLTTQ